MKTQLEIAHALRKAAAWERDPRNDGERCINQSARTGDRPFRGNFRLPGHPCDPRDAGAVQWCATGRLVYELDVDALTYGMMLGGFVDEIDAIEQLHDKRRFTDAADLLDGLALLVEETIPVTVYG